MRGYPRLFEACSKTSFDSPGAAAREALRPDVARSAGVPLAQVNAWGEVAENVGYLAGPALAGLLLAVVGGFGTVWLAVALFVVGTNLPTPLSAVAVFIVAMLALGMANGAVFQLVPQRFREEIGVMTGLVGMAGGVGGFYLASSLGFSKQLSGHYSMGFAIFAGLALLALIGLTAVKRRWRTTWGAVVQARI